MCSDDPEAAAIGQSRGAITVGADPGSTYSMGDLELHRSSVSFSLRGPEGELGTLRVGVPGLHNARNAAVAAVAALQAGAQRLRRRRRRSPASPVSPAGSNSAANRAA